MSSIYDFSADTLAGKTIHFSDYAGKVLLIVNTASKCGLAPQYEGLEALHQRFHEQGLVVIGFPCNQFGKQEQGNADEISEFCEVNYGVSFQMMAKIDVNGKHAHPLYQWLKSQKSGLLTSSIKWNFAKFLVGRDGQVIDRFAPTTKPDALINAIEQALGAT